MGFNHIIKICLAFGFVGFNATAHLSLNTHVAGQSEISHESHLTSTKAYCGPRINRETFQHLINSLITRHFPDLEKSKIEIEEVADNGESYLSTWIKLKTWLLPSQKRIYQVLINQAISSCPPSMSALEAILAHELNHLQDFVERNFFEIGLLMRHYGPQYERATDIKTLELGYGPGLIEYRQWIYSRLATPEAVAKKRKYYLTPLEIGDWMRKNPTPIGHH